MKRAALATFALLLLLSPLVLHARTTTTFGQNAVGAACNNIEKATDFDAIAQCNAGTGAGTMQTAPLILGTITAPPYANTTCDAGKAGMLQWTGTSFQACGGTSWGSFATGGALDDLTDAKTEYASLYNVFLGSGAGNAVTTGHSDTAVGYNSLYSNTTGYANTAVGREALRTNTEGVYNTAIGSNALYSNTTGTSNTAVGYQALYRTTTGVYNTAIGSNALYSNTTGIGNTAVGYEALRANTTGIRNTAVGRYSLLNSTGESNSSLGYWALGSTTTGIQNTAVGTQAGWANVNGSNNVFVGYQVGYGTLTSGSSNILIGTSSAVTTPAAGTSNWLNVGNTIYGNLSTDSIAIGSATITTGTTLDLSIKTDSMIVPKGTDAQRPTGVAGMVRYNTTSNCLEAYQGGTPAWACVGGGDSTLGTSTANAKPYRSGEINTGLFSPATGVVSVTTLGTERMRVDANGAVKIGAGAVSAGAILELSAGTGTGYSSVILPKDTTANRPTTATAGMMRFNTSLNIFEGFNGTDWLPMAPGSGEVGEIKIWPAGTIPSGYLECDGSAVSRTTYATLFAVIGTMYGAGDGTTTFNLPDYRGEFLRGWANGSTNDPDRAARTDRGDGVIGDNVGTKQAGQTLSHLHVVDPPSAASDTVANHQHSVDPPSTASDTVANHQHSIDPPSTVSADGNDNHQHSVDPPATNSGNQSSNHIHSINPPSTAIPSSGAHGHTVPVSIYSSDNVAAGGAVRGVHTNNTSTGAGQGAHTHTVDMAAFNSGGNTTSHVHATDIGAFNSGWMTANHGHSVDILSFLSVAGGGHGHTTDISSFLSVAAGGHGHTTDIASFDSTSVGGNETRPRNVSVVYIIRFKEERAASGSVAALTPQTFALSGDTTSSPVSFDGTAPVTMIATVGKIQGRSVASTAPTNGQTLVWNTSSSAWVPGASSMSTLGISTASASPYRVGEVNTGLYSPAAGNVGVVSAGTEIMRVTASGVGIGTTSPNVPLHVAAHGASGIAYFTNRDFVNASTGSGVYFGTGTSSGNTYSLLQAGINGGSNAGDLILNPYSGNVGIGTTTPSSHLTVLNSITATGNRPITIDSVLGSIIIKANTGGWATYYGYHGSSGTFRGGFGAFGTADALGYYFIGSGHDTATMYVYPDNGNVGIGTTDPVEKLAVNGLIVGGIGAQEGGGVLNWNDITNIRSGNGHTLLQGGHTNGPGAISGSYFHPFNFEYNTKNGSGNITQIAVPYGYTPSIDAGMYMRGRYGGTWSSWVRILTSNTNGYFAVGSTNTPSYQLDVTGDIRTHRNDTTGVIFLGNAGTKYLYFNGTAYHLPGASLIVNGTTYPSDRRLKTDIEPISKDSAMGVINKLEPKRFHWHPDSEQGKVNKNYDFGMIAQDVQKILPEVVLETDSTGPGSADGKKAEPKTLNEKLGKTLAIDYTRFVPWLLAGLQEVAKQLKELEARVNALLDFEPRIKKLEAENEKLKAVNDTLNARLKAIEDRLSKKP